MLHAHSTMSQSLLAWYLNSTLLDLRQHSCSIASLACSDATLQPSSATTSKGSVALSPSYLNLTLLDLQQHLGITQSRSDPYFSSSGMLQHQTVLAPSAVTCMGRLSSNQNPTLLDLKQHRVKRHRETEGMSVSILQVFWHKQHHSASTSSCSIEGPHTLHCAATACVMSHH